MLTALVKMDRIWGNLVIVKQKLFINVVGAQFQE